MTDFNITWLEYCYKMYTNILEQWNINSKYANLFAQVSNIGPSWSSCFVFFFVSFGSGRDKNKWFKQGILSVILPNGVKYILMANISAHKMELFKDIGSSCFQPCSTKKEWKSSHLDWPQREEFMTRTDIHLLPKVQN